MTAPTVSPAVSDQEYRGIKAVNWSALKHYAKSPAHYRAYIDNPPERTPAMLLGSALHCWVLEPEEFRKRYIVAPEMDRRTRAGKEAHAEFLALAAGKDVLTPEQMEAVRGMGAAVRGCHARNLVELCEVHERAITWTDPATGLACKGRPDAYSPHTGVIVDIKTTSDASPRAFQRAIATYLYHGQAAFYLDGLLADGVRAEHFIFIVVEKEPPYAVASYACDAEMIAAGRMLTREYLDMHKACLDAGQWPGYPNRVQSIELPRWAA